MLLYSLNHSLELMTSSILETTYSPLQTVTATESIAASVTTAVTGATVVTALAVIPSWSIAVITVSLGAAIAIFVIVTTIVLVILRKRHRENQQLFILKMKRYVLYWNYMCRLNNRSDQSFRSTRYCKLIALV